MLLIWTQKNVLIWSNRAVKSIAMYTIPVLEKVNEWLSCLHMIYVIFPPVTFRFSEYLELDFSVKLCLTFPQPALWNCFEIYEQNMVQNVVTRVHRLVNIRALVAKYRNAIYFSTIGLHGQISHSISPIETMFFVFFCRGLWRDLPTQQWLFDQPWFSW